MITVWLSIEVGVGFATSGPIHDWAGVLAYVIGCLALLGVGALLRRVGPSPGVARVV